MIGDDGRIDDVVGDWPAPGIEFELLGPLPKHVEPAYVPEHLSPELEQAPQKLAKEVFARIEGTGESYPTLRRFCAQPD